jgi:predicted NBD/HSP70 family sugar kinase
MANIFDPQAFVLGGSILEWYPLLEETLLSSFRSSAMNELRDVPILQSPLEGRGGVIGAALYALDELRKQRS